MRVPRVPLLSLLALLAALVWAPSAGAQAQIPTCPDQTPACIEPTSTPEAVSVRTDASTTYIRYETVVRNRGTSTMTQVEIRNKLPAGTADPVFPTFQGCSRAPDDAGRPVVTCAVGSLASGAAVTIAVTVKGPRDPGTASNEVSTTFAAGDNSGSDPKRKATAWANTMVSATPNEASSWVPANTETTISTDRTGTGVAGPLQQQIAKLKLTAPAEGATAGLKPGDRPFTCEKGQVCRGGGWTEGIAQVGGVSEDFATPLEFTLRWDKALVSRKQTARNFVLFYADTKLSDVETISRRCPTGQLLPDEDGCLKQVIGESDGDFTAVVVRRHNGYMR